MIDLLLPRSARSAIEELKELYVRGRDGQFVQVGALGRFVQEIGDKTIYHKNLKRVVYVYGEVAGTPSADAVIDMQADQRVDRGDVAGNNARPIDDRTWLAPGGGIPWSLPEGFEIVWAGCAGTSRVKTELC